MPPCRAHIKTSFVIIYSRVAAFEKYLRIGDFSPWLPVHFRRRRRGFKVTFYFIGGHGGKFKQKLQARQGLTGFCVKVFFLL